MLRQTNIVVAPGGGGDEAALMEAKLRIGTAPDSWGVWFADSPGQVPWDRFLDEAQSAGYHWIELGPVGYLPTDPHRLEDELAKRDLELSAGTVFTGFHKDDAQSESAMARALEVGALVARLGVEHLVVIPDLWRSDETSGILEPRTLTDEQWGRLASGHDRLGQRLLEEYGIHQQFHSHADSHVGTAAEVERLLGATDARYTNLCLDTGHLSYYLGDTLAMIEKHSGRIGYLHLKQVQVDVLADALKNDLPFAQAVANGVMCEPPAGVPDFAPIIEAVARIDPNIFAIVEQDMFGCAVDYPFAIAQRTREHIFGGTQAARIR
jgi:inosose dehydratase